jgi:hypothetical protein
MSELWAGGFLTLFAFALGWCARGYAIEVFLRWRDQEMRKRQ